MRKSNHNFFFCLLKEEKKVLLVSSQDFVGSESMYREKVAPSRVFHECDELRRHIFIIPFPHNHAKAKKKLTRQRNRDKR